jgi:hypothetical protein
METQIIPGLKIPLISPSGKQAWPLRGQGLSLRHKNPKKTGRIVRNLEKSGEIEEIKKFEEIKRMSKNLK